MIEENTIDNDNQQPETSEVSKTSTAPTAFDFNKAMTERLKRFEAKFEAKLQSKSEPKTDEVSEFEQLKRDLQQAKEEKAKLERQHKVGSIASKLDVPASLKPFVEAYIASQYKVDEDGEYIGDKEVEQALADIKKTFDDLSTDRKNSTKQTRIGEVQAGLPQPSVTTTNARQKTVYEQLMEKAGTKLPKGLV